MRTGVDIMGMLSPDLAVAVDEGRANPEAWRLREGKLTRADTGRRLYEGDLDDREIETQAVQHWLQSSPPCIKPFCADDISVILREFAAQWHALNVDSLEDLSFCDIYNSGEDHQFLWAASQLSSGLQDGRLRISEAVAGYSHGSLCVHGVCHLDILVHIVRLLKPRLLLIFEEDLDLIAYRCTERSEASALLAAIQDLGTQFCFVTDPDAQGAYVKAEAVITSSGILPHANIFSITLREQPSTQIINERICGTDSYLKIIRLLGFFNDELNMLANGIINLTQNKARLITFPLIKQQERHAVVVASGPSLREALPLLKKHRSRFDLISSYSTLWPLVKAGIIPDYHVQLERHTVHRTNLAFTDIVEACKQITLIGNANIDPFLADLYKDFLIFFRSASAPSALFADHISELVSGEGGEVASASIASAVLLGHKTIHLFGVDLGAATPDQARSRIDGAPGANERVFEIPVDGNRQPTAWTSQPMLELRDWIVLILSGKFQPGNTLAEMVTTFNYSDGIRIPNTKPAILSDFAGNLNRCSANTIKVKSGETSNTPGKPVDNVYYLNKLIAYDISNRFRLHLDVARHLAHNPLNDNNFKAYVQSCELRQTSLTDQVPIRLASGTLIRIWSQIILLHRLAEIQEPEDAQQWEDAARNILEKCIDSMNSMFADMLDLCVSKDKRGFYSEAASKAIAKVTNWR